MGAKMKCVDLPCDELDALITSQKSTLTCRERVRGQRSEAADRADQ